VYEYGIEDTETSIDGQVIDRIMRTIESQDLGDLQVIEEIHAIITDAYKRGII
jgi:ribosomal protein L25 (general stress protein Ctc)